MVIKWDFWPVMADMKVGESFAIPCLEPQQYTPRVHAMARKVGIEVETAFITEDNYKALRVWRIK